jgi:hypothetical protein
MAKKKGGGFGRLSIPTEQQRKQKLMNAYEMYSSDKAKETDGIILDFGDFRVKVCRAGGANTAYAKMMEELARPYRRAMETGVLSPEIGDKIMREVYAKTVIKGWDGGDKDKPFPGPDGPLEFNEANVIQVLTDLPDFFASLRGECERIANFRKDAMKAEVKN